MDFAIEEFLTYFVRTYLEPFYARTVSSFLAQKGLKIPAPEIAEYLEGDHNVFPLERRLFITRAGAFTNQIFSFTVTRQEFSRRLFVAGDRCLPFVDAEVHPASIRFTFMGKTLPTVEYETDSGTACELFSLYGDEYAAQYIGADPATAALHLADCNFELPPRLTLTAVSLEPLIDYGIQYGDRILARVSDWDNSVVELFPLQRENGPYQLSELDMERGQWNATLEGALLESFRRLGPCSSMEEQLANVFFENRRTLCVLSCGSVKEFLRASRKVGMECFGVETRLWRRGEDVPAVGEWNGHTFGMGGDGTLPLFSLQGFVIDAYLKDTMYEKKDDITPVIETLLPAALSLSAADREFLTLKIKERNDILRKEYNWFADSAYGALRHDVLALYTDISALIYELDLEQGSAAELPQQELAVFSQLYTHTVRMLESLMYDDITDEDAAVMQNSIEGMEYNFEDIRPVLLDAIDGIRRRRFSIIKK